MLRLVFLVLLLVPLAACAGTSADSGWRSLFDGRTTAGWRGYRRADVPAGWQVVDGALTRVGEAGDLVTAEPYTDFELELEWKVAPGGNSGVMFRVTEDHDYPWETGPEFQILDDAAHKDGLDPRTSAGANYAMHAPSAEAARPAGEWNQARLVVRGAHVEHWLNGQKIVAYELWSPDWEARVQACKWKERPDYGRRRSGHIALQDHGDAVAYRNLRIRVLE
ncbi:MAG TPA: DUF1080 domain-containing protein [Planctomycetota bacterium]